jgi:HemY protein
MRRTPASATAKRLGLLLVAGLLLGAAVGVGLWLRTRSHRIDPEQVRAATPAIPDLAGWPREFAAKVRAATAAAERREQPLRALSELAFLYHANGFFREAEQVERGLHALEPRNADWLYLLADVCHSIGDMAGTEQFLARTVEVDPKHHVAHLKLADLLFKRGQASAAARHYETRLALVPRDPYARFGLARIALYQRDGDGARRQLEWIATHCPDFPTAHNVLAGIYEQTGEHRRAAEERERGLNAGRFRAAEDPLIDRLYAWSCDPYRLEVLGAMRMQAGQLQQSLPFYEKAVELAPRDGPARDALAEVYLQLGRFEDARAALDAGIAATPDYPPLYSTMAGLLRRQSKHAEAIAILQRGLRALPESSELYNDIGISLEAAGRQAEAINAYREATRLNPNFPEAHLNLGLCLLAAGDTHAAQQSLDRTLRLRPADLKTLVALARKAFEEERLDAAEGYVRTLQEFRPGLPATRQLTGLLHLRRGNRAAAAGRVDDAAAEFRAGLVADPESPDLHANLGVLHARAGQHEAAIAEFQLALNADPANSRLLLYLGRVLLQAGRAPEAREVLVRGLASARAAGQAELQAQISQVLGSLGW